MMAVGSAEKIALVKTISIKGSHGLFSGHLHSNLTYIINLKVLKSQQMNYLWLGYIDGIPARQPRWLVRSNSQGEVKFNLYSKGSTFDTPETNERGDKITFRRLLAHIPTKIVIHGWRGDGDSEFFKDIVSGYLSQKSVNVITVDWSGLGSKNLNYAAARSKVPEVATIVAKFIDNLHKQRSINLDKVHIIGHSLGAHIAGIAGYLVTTGKIGRITGLDPAQPLFSLYKPRERLSTDSAKFVDVIHSSSNLEGFAAPIGHADFYPNGPLKHQPGCGTDVAGICSHRRAIYYYVESISNPKGFPAVPCVDWNRFQKKECNAQRRVFMGENITPSAWGSFFLATNFHAPFAKNTVWS